MISDYFRLALKSARQRQVRTWLTMLGIFIGIAAVVALISLSQGLQNAVSQQFVQLGTDKLIIQPAGSSFGPPGTGSNVELTNEDKEVIEKSRGVDLVIGRLVRTAKLEFKEEIKYSWAVTMPRDEEERELTIEANNYHAESGRLLEKNDLYKAMVGKGFAEDFFDEPLEIRSKIFVQDQGFEVIGILEKSGNPQQDDAIVIPERALRALLDIPYEYDVIPVKVEAGFDTNVVAENVADDLRKSRNVEEGKEDFSIQTPENLLEILFNLILIIQGVLVGIAAISLVVGGIGIMNTMYTAVLERTKEIGIMKATGAKNNQVLALFLIESGFLGFLGGLIGVILGFGASKLVEIIAFQIYGSFLIQADFNIFVMAGALMFAFTVGTLSGFLPARQASKLSPVEALRK
jgi:putative ABC transport system permease protein